MLENILKYKYRFFKIWGFWHQWRFKL